MDIPFFKSLRFKISISYFILVGISVFITIWAIINFNRLGSSVDQIIRENYLNVIAAENMVKSQELLDNALVAFISTKSKRSLDAYKKSSFDYFQWFQKTSEHITHEQHQSILDTIQMYHIRYVELADTVMLFVMDEQLHQIAKSYHFNNIRPVNEILKQSCFRLIELNQQEMFDLDKRARKIASEASYAVLIASLFAVTLSIIAGVQYTRSIVEPAERLTSTVKKIGRGRLDLKTDILTDDEFGELSREFNKMTERLRRFEALNIEKILEEKQKSETIVKNISDAIIVCDKKENILLINEAARNLLKIDTPCIENIHISKLIKDERVISILTDPSSDKFTNQPYLLFKLDEKDVYIRPQVSEIPLAKGEKSGTVLILQDVTQFKQLDKMKSEFMATVSHEFRTPLTSINMTLDLINQGIVGEVNPEQQELLKSAKHDANRLTKLVRELLELSRLESGKFQFKKELISINEIIQDSIQPILLPIKEKSINLILHLSENIPKFTGDAQQFSWVISNLVNNALKYTPEGGAIEITSSVEINEIMVSIKDTGKGISEENLSTIFDKFVQVKGTLESTPGSVGLGLAIAKEIVQMYGGEIWAESEFEKGSVFYFTIPLENEEKYTI